MIMKLKIDNIGNTIQLKDWINVDCDIVSFVESPFGTNYITIGLNSVEDSNLIQFLQLYEEQNSLRFYFYEDILYITSEDDNFHYLILFGEDFEALKSQMLHKNEILFSIFDSDKNLEFFLGYNNIIK